MGETTAETLHSPFLDTTLVAHTFLAQAASGVQKGKIQQNIDLRYRYLTE
jgi:hypothetical protein